MQNQSIDNQEDDDFSLSIIRDEDLKYCMSQIQVRQTPEGPPFENDQKKGRNLYGDDRPTERQIKNFLSLQDQVQSRASQIDERMMDHNFSATRRGRYLDDQNNLNRSQSQQLLNTQKSLSLQQIQVATHVSNSEINATNQKQEFQYTNNSQDSDTPKRKSSVFIPRSYTRTKTQAEINKEKDQFTTNYDQYLTKDIKYISRRSKNYNDAESGSEDNGQKITGCVNYKDTKGRQITIRPNAKFKAYRDLFTNLLHTQSVLTQFPIISMCITYDSTLGVTVSKQSEYSSWIKMYDLNTGELSFEEQIGGNPSQYIKCSEIVQNEDGTKYAVAYNDDGKFRLRTFGKKMRNQLQIDNSEVRINEIIDLDNHTMCNDDFPDPFITICFVSDTLVFVSFFHSLTLTHYHFIYDVKFRRFIGDTDGFLIKRKMDCTKKNFPQKCFYNAEDNEIYVFYRQGQAFVINAYDLEDYRYEIMTDSDLGQMVLIKGEALIARSSSRILFFKQVTDEITNATRWKLYHQIRIRGFIYYIKGNIRIQITTDDLIYFYLIDMETYMPQLENCMYNFMGCNQMMFGQRVKYGISYKTNQRSFEIYRRKYLHVFKMNANDKDFEGSKGIELITMNTFLVTKIDQVIMFDSDTFQVCGEIPIKLLDSDTRERTEILGLQKSKDENWLAIISGKNLVMNQQKQNQLFIFKRIQAKDPLDYDHFQLSKRIVVKDFPEFNRVGMKYYFKNSQDGADPDTIIFAKMECIFELNFMTEQIEIIHMFKPSLKCQPDYFVSDPDQNKFVTASQDDGIWVDLNTHQEVDLDQLYDIKMILDIVYDTETKEFYLLCNRRYEKVGFFLVKFANKDPKIYKFMTMIQNNLDIGDVNMYILRGNDSSGSYKELVCGYKTIYINVYNLDVFDLSGDEDKRATLLRHESFQLWESKVSGMILFKNKDFIKLSKTGIDVLSQGPTPKRVMMAPDGSSRVIHSLDAFSFLKLDPINYLNFKCQDYNNRILSIEQELTVQNKDGRQYNVNQTIYSIKIHEITLRELMILQSIYISKKQSDIVNLVKLQPDQKFFYKTFLELDGSNMASLLAFDSRSIECLLSYNNKQYFSSEFPLIYKNRLKKRNGRDFYYHSAIDVALKNNQVRAVNLMIQYAVEYQNNYFSSYLFAKLLPALINKGIKVFSLLDSNIFTQTFDYDEWPGNHTNDAECLRGYSHSFFHLRHHYKQVFPEDEFSVIENSGKNDDDQVYQSSKVFKIKYSINLLMQASFHMKICGETGQHEKHNEHTSLMAICTESDELEIFNSKALQQLIEFKWLAYGQRHHLLGCLMHIFYLVVFILYVKNAIIESSDRDQDFYYAIWLLIGILYPACYEALQLYRDGIAHYVQDLYNFADFIYIWGSLANSILQIVYGPQVVLTKVIMITLVILLITKTFFFLRMVDILTPIVVMITTVIYDLRIFLLFFLILIGLFAQIFAVIGLGNAKLRLDYTVHKKKQLAVNLAEDYKTIGLHLGEFMWTLRMSMGDMSCVEDAKYLAKSDNIMFWICWLFTVVVTCIIFLNFIVAEACASYSKVIQTLEEVIWKEKTALISESEEMTFEGLKTPEKYPPYIIVRQIES